MRGKSHLGKVSHLERSQVFPSDDPEECEKPVGPEMEELVVVHWIWVPGYLGDVVGSGPDHCNKVNAAVKQVILLPLEEDLAYKTQHL